MVLGIAWAIHNKEHISLFFSQVGIFVGDLIDSIYRDFPEPLKGRLSIFQILVALVLIVIVIIIGLVGLLVFVILYILNLIFWLLAKIYIGYAIIGIIFIYPFYVIFINLFELFLLLMIQHPSKSEIRRIIGRRRISDENIASISEKMMPFSGKIPHVVESEIMTSQIKGLTKMIQVEIGFLRNKREKMIRDAMRSFEKA